MEEQDPVCHISMIRHYNQQFCAPEQLCKNTCEFVKKFCGEEEGGQFTQLYFCEVNESSMGIFLFIAFHMLSSTAENYLSPAVQSLSNSLGLSETLAAVTLVAFGNGAPDVLVSVAAGGGEDEGGISFSIGSIFGAGLFVTSFTLAKVLEASSKDTKPKPAMFLRDTIFYFSATTLLLVYGFVGYIQWWMALLFVSIYLFYIIFVVFQERQQSQDLLLNSIKDDIKKSEVEYNQTDSFAKTNPTELKSVEISSLNNQQNVNSNNNKSSLQDKLIEKKFNEDDDEDDGQIINTTIKGVIHRFNKLRRSFRNELLNAKDNWKDMEFQEKLLYLWEFPVDFVRDLTIPCADENWNKWRAIVNCVTAPLFFIFFNGMISQNAFDPFHKHYYVAIIVGVIGLIFSIIVWKTSHQDRAPSYVGIFSLIAFINSIVWIGQVANLLVDFLEFIQLTTQVSKVYLGMTFLAYGNSASDFFTNPQLAKAGYEIMAFTACFAGQLFNLLVGFGLTLILQTIGHPNEVNGVKEYKMAFKLFDGGDSTYEKFQALIGYGIMIATWLNALIIIIIGITSKFTFGKKVSQWLSLYYIIIFILFTIFGIVSDLLRASPDNQKD